MREKRYPNDYPSVTEVLSEIRKAGLEYWYKMHTKKFCDIESAKGKEIGTQLHKVLEEYTKTGKAEIKTEYALEVQNAFRSFKMFSRDYHPIEYLKNEIRITSESLKLNGTVDAFAKRGEGITILDWKTSNCKGKAKPLYYTEHALQVSAYYKMAMDMFQDTEQFISGAIVVVMAKDKTAYNVLRLDAHGLERGWEAFSHLYEYIKTKKSLEAIIKETNIQGGSRVIRN
jgi:RecB family exonuclease